MFNQTLFTINKTCITLGSLVEFLLIVIVTFIIAKIVKYQINRFGKKHNLISSSGIYAISRVSSYIIIILGLLAGFTSIGFDLSTFTLIASALSVGIGFGLQSIFSNFVSGILLLFEKNLRIGDHIELDSGQSGVIKEIFVRTTLIDCGSGKTMIVPNSDLISKRITICKD